MATSRLQEKYKKELRPELQKELGYSNGHAMPKLEKIVLNMGMGTPTGIGGQSENKGVMEGAIKDLATITGQKPLVTRARVSVAAFKIRQGKEVGIMVTLRGQRMWEFLDRLISVTIPRIRDFRGLPANSFDEAGNYSFGLTEHTVFPEIDLTKVQKTLGMNITLTIKARKREDAQSLLKSLGFPFRQN